VTALEAALRQICTDLTEARSSHAVVGGLAVSARTEPRFTRDADIAVAVASDAEAEEPVRTLQGSGYTIEALVEQDAVGRLATVRLTRSRDAMPPVVDCCLRDDVTRPQDVGDLRALILAASPGDITRARHALGSMRNADTTGGEISSPNQRRYCLGNARPTSSGRAGSNQAPGGPPGTALDSAKAGVPATGQLEPSRFLASANRRASSRPLNPLPSSWIQGNGDSRSACWTALFRRPGTDREDSAFLLGTDDLQRPRNILRITLPKQYLG